MKEIEEEIMIQYYNGSIFDSKADILCHQVNCRAHSAMVLQDR